MRVSLAVRATGFSPGVRVLRGLPAFPPGPPPPSAGLSDAARMDLEGRPAHRLG